MANRGKRFVFDTNVVVSALLTKKSVARDALDKARGLGEILLSLKVIEELVDVLGRPAFDRYLDEEDRIGFLNLLVKESTLVEITEKIKECRDPKDDKFLELAVSGKADFIISGDGDLRVLNPFRKIKIVSPREFLEADI
jgi:putative PIN family toxin of toxin-antitoxin system